MTQSDSSLPEDKGSAAPKCPKAPSSPGDPNRIYALPGVQVEPQSAFWNEPGPRGSPHVLPMVAIRSAMKGKVKPYPRDKKTLDAEIKELCEMANDRDKDISSKISSFVQLRPVAFGTRFNTKRNQDCQIKNIDRWHERLSKPETPPKDPVVKTGRELAWMFERETPGLSHRHALNLLLFDRSDISPARHARIWLALELAIYSSLNAAWYYKWAGPPDVSFRQRPYEYDSGKNFTVLYDVMLDSDGEGEKGPIACANPSPGTPRHPAYPSGHSTHSQAASDVLAYFFPELRTEFQKLADNIGEARLYAGVHWRTDHTFAQTLGKVVAQLVIDQFQNDCVPALKPSTDTTPAPCRNVPTTTPQQVPAFRELRDNDETQCEKDHDVIPPRPKAPVTSF